MFKKSLCIVSVVFGCSVSAGTVSTLDPTVDFQAVHRIGPSIWASGTQGGIFHSQDNGIHWQKVAGPAETQSLQFRDIQPLEDGSVVIMSAGEGAASRVYRSDSTLANWQLQAQGMAPETFYDCLHFSSMQQAWLYGDSDKTGLFILATQDGGATWQRQSLPFAAQADEGGFASSGTCINQGQNKTIYIGTGNTQNPRILVKEEKTWQIIDTPFGGGEAAGIFSVQQSGPWLYAFGGSLKTEQQPAVAKRYNLDTHVWYDLPIVPLKGAIYGSALITTNNTTHVLISNPQGVSLWQEDADTWTSLSTNNIWSLSCDDKLGCVGAGKEGLVERFTFN
ncbi:MAG: hypothetical protein NWQ54_10330 [Paraglaciecola sp.]|nr:hypothetical protein [Paraglaciecola sp.]